MRSWSQVDVVHAGVLGSAEKSQAWETPSLFQKAATKPAPFGSGGRHNLPRRETLFYYYGQEKNPPSSQEGETISIFQDCMNTLKRIAGIKSVSDSSPQTSKNAEDPWRIIPCSIVGGSISSCSWSTTYPSRPSSGIPVSMKPSLLPPGGSHVLQSLWPC